MKVLVLGGTAEGRELATLLRAQGLDVVSSLAGRVPEPALPEGEVRVGGFGGATGLAGYLVSAGVDAVVDATHPFAARMTASAAEACAATGVQLVVVRRPAWQPGPGDDWRPVPSLAGAAVALGEFGADTRVLLTTGRQGAAAFRDCPHRFWLRAVQAPDAADLPRRCELILQRGPFQLDAERELLRILDIQVVVSKNSGGPMTAAKLAAARERGIPVIMVQRPSLPPGLPVVETPADAVRRMLA
jgi:precorrin-6A/cobalt-precorrin-6A reductase